MGSLPGRLWWIDPRVPRERKRERRERDAARRAHFKEAKRAEAPLLQALKDAGLRIRGTDELVNRRDLDYDAQIPVLIEWLPRMENEAVKDMIARALMEPAARPQAAPVVLAEVRRCPEYGDLTQYSLGLSLGYLADRSYFDEIVEIVEDPCYGRARPELVRWLGRFKRDRERAIPVLRRLLEDEEDLGRYALAPLAKLGASEARDEIERYTRHPQDWVRTEARRALRKLDKAG